MWPLPPQTWRQCRQCYISCNARVSMRFTQLSLNRRIANLSFREENNACNLRWKMQARLDKNTCWISACLPIAQVLLQRWKNRNMKHVSLLKAFATAKKGPKAAKAPDLRQTTRSFWQTHKITNCILCYDEGRNQVPKRIPKHIFFEQIDANRLRSENSTSHCDLGFVFRSVGSIAT